MSKSLLNVCVELPVKHVTIFISHIIGVSVEDMQHLLQGPLHDGSGTAMGCRLNTLRDNDMFRHQNGQAPAARKMVGALLPGCRPDTMPARCNASLSQGIDLRLVKCVFLYKNNANLLGAQPSDRASGATHTGRLDAKFAIG